MTDPVGVCDYCDEPVNADDHCPHCPDDVARHQLCCEQTEDYS